MKALLIIDVQKSAVTDKEMAQRIETLQNEYKHVYVSQFVNDKSPVIKLTGWNGYSDTALAFTPIKTAKVFQKSTYSSYLDDFKQFDEVHLCGFDTDACVYMTAMDLIDHGIRPVVLSQYCGSKNQQFHLMGLELLRRNIGPENII